MPILCPSYRRTEETVSVFTWHLRKPNYWVSPTMIRSCMDLALKMHVYTLVWLKSDQIGFLIVELKYPDYSIDSHITPACIRSSGSDRIFAQAQDFSPWPWARSRRTAAAASFLRNHRKKECHCASILCNYHVHHIRSVQRCSFVSLFVRHLSWMPRQLET